MSKRFKNIPGHGSRFEAVMKRIHSLKNDWQAVKQENLFLTFLAENIWAILPLTLALTDSCLRTGIFNFGLACSTLGWLFQVRLYFANLRT